MNKTLRRISNRYLPVILAVCIMLSVCPVAFAETSCIGMNFEAYGTSTQNQYDSTGQVMIYGAFQNTFEVAQFFLDSNTSNGVRDYYYLESDDVIYIDFSFDCWVNNPFSDSTNTEFTFYCDNSSMPFTGVDISYLMPNEYDWSTPIPLDMYGNTYEIYRTSNGSTVKRFNVTGTFKVPEGGALSYFKVNLVTAEAIEDLLYPWNVFLWGICHNPTFYDAGRDANVNVNAINLRLEILESIYEYLTEEQYNLLLDILDLMDSIDDNLSLGNTYLLQLIGKIDDLNDDITALLQVTYNDVHDIKSSLQQLNSYYPNIANKLLQIVNLLIAQGDNFNYVLNFLQIISDELYTISHNSDLTLDYLDDLYGTLIDIVQQNEDRNDKLDEILEAIENINIDIDQVINNYNSNDGFSLGGFLKSVISRFLSLFRFISDFFGNPLTSVPKMISGFNDASEFWGLNTSYQYKPYQIGDVSADNIDFTNSPASVERLFEVANQYLGYPYVWGGSSPETSFDCSGFVCWCLNESGVYTLQRTTAQGLYNRCTVVSASDAVAGDLVFFAGTYNSTDHVTHVGIYAGNGRMIHAGDPISYANVSAFGNSLYAFGRLPYNNVP